MYIPSNFIHNILTKLIPQYQKDSFERKAQGLFSVKHSELLVGLLNVNTECILAPSTQRKLIQCTSNRLLIDYPFGKSPF